MGFWLLVFGLFLVLIWGFGLWFLVLFGLGIGNWYCFSARGGIEVTINFCSVVFFFILFILFLVIGVLISLLLFFLLSIFPFLFIFYLIYCNIGSKCCGIGWSMTA